MARVCLPKEERDRMITALKSRELSISDLYKMTSPERRAKFQQYLPDDQAELVNAKFEEAMLSNQKRALTNWVRNTTSQKEPIRKILLERIDRNKKFIETANTDAFLEDVAQMKLGITASKTEMRNILKMKQSMEVLEKKWDPTTRTWATPEAGFEYGMLKQTFKDYVGNIKLQADTLKLGERVLPKNFSRQIVDAAGAAKALKATLDLSYSLRQGIKTLLSGNPKIWWKSFKTGLKVFGKELFAKSNGLFKDSDHAALNAVKADIWQRPYAMDGTYRRAKNGFNLGVDFEEAFPSSAPEKVPFLGRFFKASQDAYEASALRMRADLADAMLDKAVANGVDITDEAQVTAIGSLVGSMTGRGGIGRLEPMSRGLNALFFAPRFLKANLDTLTGHAFDKTISSATPFARKEAIKNTMKIAASIGSILAIAEAMNPGSTEPDPRSSNFGKIKVDGKWVDITGGMSGLVTLSSRMTGKTKSRTSGKITSLTDGGFGSNTRLDVLEFFFEGKFSPGAGVVRDWLKGENFQGEKPNLINVAVGLTVPISVENIYRDLQEGNDDFLVAAILEGLGLSVTRETMRGYGKRWETLKEKVSTEEYNDALVTLTKNFNKKAEKLQDSAKWDRLDQEERNKELDKIRKAEQDRVFRRYNIK